MCTNIVQAVLESGVQELQELAGLHGEGALAERPKTRASTKNPVDFSSVTEAVVLSDVMNQSVTVMFVHVL